MWGNVNIQNRQKAKKCATFYQWVSLCLKNLAYIFVGAVVSDYKGLTDKEIAFAKGVAGGSSRFDAAKAAKYSHPGVEAYRLMLKPDVIGEIARVHRLRIATEVLPLAVETHLMLLRSPATPAAARVAAVKLAYEHGLGDYAAEDKDPCEMTADELARAIQRLQLEASDRAVPIVEGEAKEALDPAKPSGFFD